MASTHKTPFLQLNQWLGTDKPKRDDFNADNLNIDAKMQAHNADTVKHLTAAERNAWNKKPYVIGTYTGNGTVPTRTVALGYQPDLLLLFAVERTISEFRSISDSNNVLAGIGTRLGATYGLELNATGFTVRQNSTTVGAGNTCALNINGTTYVYIAFA